MMVKTVQKKQSRNLLTKKNKKIKTSIFFPSHDDGKNCTKKNNQEIYLQKKIKK